MIDPTTERATQPQRRRSGRGMHNPSEQLGNRLGRRIYQQALSDRQLAAQVGLSRAQLNRIRNGRAIPRLRTAVALASALGCRVKDLFYLKSGSGR